MCSLPYGSEHFVALNPDLLVELSREYLRHANYDSSPNSAVILEKGIRLLQTIVAQER